MRSVQDGISFVFESTPERVPSAGGTVGSVHNPHFAAVESVDEAESLLLFRPSLPAVTAGCVMESIAVFVMDHRRREVPVELRSVELHYGRFVVSQQRPGPVEARRLALDVSYGREPIEVHLASGPGRAYELGPVTDDADGRAPAVVVWVARDRFHLVGSSELTRAVLIEIAGSVP